MIKLEIKIERAEGGTKFILDSYLKIDAENNISLNEEEIKLIEAIKYEILKKITEINSGKKE